MEYLSGGSLGKVPASPETLQRGFGHFLFSEILLGLEYLHDTMGVIYRDLKPDNILLNSNGHIKITDFGLSKEENPDGYLAYAFAGTPEYLAQEILLGKGHAHIADYWSLGILIFEITPFSVPRGMSAKLSRRSWKINQRFLPISMTLQ